MRRTTKHAATNLGALEDVLEMISVQARMLLGGDSSTLVLSHECRRAVPRDLRLSTDRAHPLSQCGGLYHESTFVLFGALGRLVGHGCGANRGERGARPHQRHAAAR
jgi:hypothetical protein